MLGNVLESLREHDCPQGVIVVATEHVDLCQAELGRIKLPWPVSIIAESRGAGTAPAAAAAAEHVQKTQGAQCVMAVMPADRHVGDPVKFAAAIDSAVGAADDQLVVLGIVPTKPSSRYGYVFVDQKVGAAFKVSRFVEKPSPAKAQNYVNAGNCYWNAGIFVMRAATYLQQLRSFCPQLANKVDKLSAHTHVAGQIWNVPDEFSAELGQLSIDVEIAEKANNLLLIPATDTSWRDLGDWDDFARLLAEDDSKNRLYGKVATAQAHNVNVLANAGRLVAVAGCSDINVIDTPDAVLVSAQHGGDALRELYGQLQNDKEQSVISPAVEQRPWGNYRQLGSGPGWQVKRIEVNARSRLSLQSHRHRSEQWTVVQGTVAVTINDQIQTLTAGQACHIPLGARHRMENRTDEPAVVVEVQSGSYLGEDDIQRYEDDFGRS